MTIPAAGQGLTVWVAALWKKAGGPGTQAECGSAVKANHVLGCISKSVASRLVENIISF